MYTLIDTYKTKADLTKDDAWRVSLGSISNDSQLDYSKDVYSSISGVEDDIVLKILTDMSSKKQKFVDRTGGIQSYFDGAKNIDTLLRDNEVDGEGFVLKTMVVGTEKEQNLRFASLSLATEKVYNGGVFVIDVKQIPTSCGVWATFGLLAVEDVKEWKKPTRVYRSRWPQKGEIGLVEMVNESKVADFNNVSLKSDQTCKVSEISQGAGQKENPEDFECSKAVRGCYSTSRFNDLDENRMKIIRSDDVQVGSVFVFEWVQASDKNPNGSLKSWRLPRDDSRLNKSTIDVGGLGVPVTEMKWTNTTCGEDSNKDMHLVLKLAFGGDLPNTSVCYAASVLTELHYSAAEAPTKSILTTNTLLSRIAAAANKDMVQPESPVADETTRERQKREFRAAQPAILLADYEWRVASIRTYGVNGKSIPNDSEAESESTPGSASIIIVISIVVLVLGFAVGFFFFPPKNKAQVSKKV